MTIVICAMRVKLKQPHLSLVNDDKTLRPAFLFGFLEIGVDMTFTFEGSLFCPGWAGEDEGVFLDVFVFVE